jgi:hypothetical protein
MERGKAAGGALVGPRVILLVAPSALSPFTASNQDHEQKPRLDLTNIKMVIAVSDNL